MQLATALLVDGEAARYPKLMHIELVQSSTSPISQRLVDLQASHEGPRHPAAHSATVCRLPVGFGKDRWRKSMTEDCPVKSIHSEVFRWLTIGGVSSDGKPIRTCMLHTVRQKSIQAQTLQPLHVKRISPIVLPWPDGYVTVIGGDEGGAGTIEYAKAINSQGRVCAHWSVSPSVFLGEEAAQRDNGRFSYLIIGPGKILLFGGSCYEVTYSRRGSELTFAFARIGQGRAPRWNVGCCQVGPFVFVVGGRNGLGPRRTVEIYDLDTKSWMLSPLKLKYPREGCEVCSSGKVLVIFGGAAKGQPVRSTEVFGVWQFFANDLEAARAQMLETLHSLRLPKTGRLVVRTWAQWNQRVGQGPQFLVGGSLGGLNQSAPICSRGTWMLKARSFRLPAPLRLAAPVAVSVALAGGALACTWQPGTGPDYDEGHDANLSNRGAEKSGEVSTLSSEYFDDDSSDCSITNDPDYAARCDAVERSNHAQLRALTLTQVVMPLQQNLASAEGLLHTRTSVGLHGNDLDYGPGDVTAETTWFPSLEAVDSDENPGFLVEDPKILKCSNPQDCKPSGGAKKPSEFHAPLEVFEMSSSDTENREISPRHYRDPLAWYNNEGQATTLQESAKT